MAAEKIKVIYEDDNILVLNKEAGIVVTRENKNSTGTVEEWLIRRKGINLIRGGLVHRIDKGTSGLLLVAKDEESLVGLKRQFKERKVVKKYLALVEGDTSESGEVNVPISRSNYIGRRFSASVNGKRALTSFRKIGVYMISGVKCSLLEVEIKTGRTHQIRVHMSYLGWPLVGDKLYGSKIDVLGRPFLQAAYMEFIHPKNGEKVSFSCQLSDDLKEILCLK